MVTRHQAAIAAVLSLPTKCQEIVLLQRSCRLRQGIERVEMKMDRDDCCMSAPCRWRWSWLRASPAPRRRNNSIQQDAPSEPALELPTDEPIDLSTPEPEEHQGHPGRLSERPLASPWDSKVGIDYRKPSIPATNFQPDQLTAGAIPDQSTGVAWATVTAPGFGSALGWDQTAIETRVDPVAGAGPTRHQAEPLRAGRRGRVGDAGERRLDDAQPAERRRARPRLGEQPGAALQCPAHGYDRVDRRRHFEHGRQVAAHA